jgi:predicted helicase
MNFFTLLNIIRKEAYTEKDKGTRFERLFKNYLLTSKKYAEMLEKVWLWEEFPFRKDFGGKDTGIDLVAKAVDGGYWAIQCKCYKADTVINKGAVDSFLATSSRTFKDEEGKTTKFSFRLWVATTEKWGINAREAMENQDPQVAIVNAFDIDNDTTVDWDKINEGLHGKKAENTEKREPRPHQREALAKAHEYYKTNDRGKLIMACGTGKTYVSLRMVENETKNKGLILVLVPSIALINQTLNEWNAYSEKPIFPICVCSDSTASRLRSKDSDDAIDTPVDLAMPACTNVESVVRQIATACQKAKGMVVVYSTYQSIEVVGEAQKYLNGEKKFKRGLFGDEPIPERDYTFDYIICDEAHRTTGVTLSGKDESAFVKVHDNKNIKGKKRLYMTATPRIYEASAKKKAEENSVMICSMDDENYYGKEIYRIGFGEAVEKGLLSDYKVLILTVRDDVSLPADVMSSIQDKTKEINTDDAVKLVGCINALSKRVVPDPDIVKSVDPAPMHKAVAFCSRISDSKAISNSFNEYANKIVDNFDEQLRDETVRIEAKHVDGSMSANVRNELLAWLRNAPTSGNDCRILTNVRCLSEGVDVPSLDAVIFLSARNSQVDVVQSVGRVMRVAPGKKYGYIIIPVVIPSQGDPNEILDNNDNYKVIWTVLNALRAHDDRFNAYVNKLELNEKPPKGGGTVTIGPGTTRTDDPHGDPGIITKYQQMLLFDENVQKALYAKMVLKVGTKRYWEQWADDIAKIARQHIIRINRLIIEDENYKTGFDMYMDGLHKNINPNITEDAAIEMLAQHMITKPVFEALFENYKFVDNNPISKSMKKLLDLVEETAYEKDQNQVTLQRFYKSVRERCEGIDNASGKQKIILELYDKFFKKAMPTTVEKLGIVYTPVEIVDFINQSVSDILKKEFKRNLSDENVHIIDPFTGTGTFITRMIQSGLINKEDLKRKYAKELHANEIVLLAYYIASINIENAYHDIIGEKKGNYTPFEGICLTDTFQLYEDEVQINKMPKFKYSDVFPQNSKRVTEQIKLPMQIIIANPPYSIGQIATNDNAQNEHYPKLEARITKTYSEKSTAVLQKGLYDSYIKAFRWASDRLNLTNGGIIGFVTNAGWLDGAALAGMRKCFEKEFSDIYIYNLRGNQRTIGETSRREGGKIFASGSRAPIAITILVRNPKTKEKKTTIYYREVEDYLTREEKLNAISKIKSVATKGFTQKILRPNKQGDWLNQRSEKFIKYIQVAPEKKFTDTSNSFFSTIIIGMATNRDSWVYSYSKEKLLSNMEIMISTYNSEIRRVQKASPKNLDEFITSDKQKISWTRGLKRQLAKGIKATYSDKPLNYATYRPFNIERYYSDRLFIESPGVFDKIFPTIKHENVLICVSGIGSNREMSTLITNHIADLQLLSNCQCFPMYWYELHDASKDSMGSLFDTAKKDGPKYIRHDGITDYILKEAQSVYKAKSITKEDIFYYVYGLLHSEDYRTQFAADLKKMLPRIPLVDSAADFKAFSKAGRALADLHLNYEKRKPPKGVIVEGDDGKHYEVEKMKFRSKEDKSEIIYNSHITIKNIPLEAYDYFVNGRSAIEWIMERYRIMTDKASGITNDPNDWSREHHDKRYILDLLLSIITVSVETMKIVKSLPKIKFE